MEMDEVLKIITKRIVHRLSVNTLEPVSKYTLLSIPEGIANHYPQAHEYSQAYLDSQAYLGQSVKVITY